MRKLVFAATASGLVMAAGVSAQTPEKPRLIVAISIDQFSSDIYSQFRNAYSGGLKRLDQGVVFPRGHQGHAATETCPGHSTILTGSRPARTGIIANDWQNPAAPRTDAKGRTVYDVYCAEDPKATDAAHSLVVSHGSLKVPTLGDRLKIVSPASRVVAVSGKDRAAVMMGGHTTDLTIWWDGKAFVTYPQQNAALPKATATINARAAASIAKPKPIPLPKACAASSRPLAIPGYDTVGVLAPRKAGNERRWRATPDFDAVTMDMALAALGEMKLGQGNATDVLAVSLSGTDYAGHTFGTGGAESCTQVMAVDAQLGRLFAALDGRKIPYAVVLTADHGGHDTPERNTVQALPQAERADAALSANAVGAALAKQFGLKENALIGRSNFGDIYLSLSVPADKRVAVRDAAIAAYRGHRQVEAVFSKDDLIATPAPTRPVDEWSLIERAKASFDPERSGDLLVLLKEYVTPIPDPAMGYVATHGSPWGYDRRVPILFWWKGISGFEQPNAVETADILPTLASLIGLNVPKAEIDGRCLDLIAGAPSNCP